MCRRLALSTPLTAIGLVAIDICSVESLVPASGPFRVELEGIVAAGPYRLVDPVPLGGDSDGVW